jgi:hypothetical protein
MGCTPMFITTPSCVLVSAGLEATTLFVAGILHSVFVPVQCGFLYDVSTHPYQMKHENNEQAWLPNQNLEGQFLYVQYFELK